MPKYVIPEGPPTLTGSLPGGGGHFGLGPGGGPPHAAAAMGLGHGRRYSHFAHAGSGAREAPPRGGGRRESNGSGRTTPSSLPVRLMLSSNMS